MSSRIRQLLVIVGAIATVLLALTQLYDWVTAPSSDLVAEVRYGSLRYPPGLDAEFEAIHNRLSHSELAKLAEGDRWRPQTPEGSADVTGVHLSFPGRFFGAERRVGVLSANLYSPLPPACVY